MLIITPLLNITDSNTHPIDVQLNDCLAQSHATMPRARCYNKAYTAWEQAISTAENKLLKNADGLKRKKLIDEQSTWEKQRDLAFEKIADRYIKMKGTGYIAVRIQLRMEILRNRALALERQLRL